MAPFAPLHQIGRSSSPYHNITRTVSDRTFRKRVHILYAVFFDAFERSSLELLCPHAFGHFFNPELPGTV